MVIRVGSSYMAICCRPNCNNCYGYNKNYGRWWTETYNNKEEAFRAALHHNGVDWVPFFEPKFSVDYPPTHVIRKIVI